MATIHKGGDPMDPNIYRSIMIGHMLIIMMEVEINDYIETLISLQAPWMVGFFGAFSIVDHVFTLESLTHFLLLESSV